MYSPLARFLPTAADVPYVHLGQSALSFSRKAVVEFGIHKHETAALFFEGEPGSVSRIVVHLGGNLLRFTAPTKSGLIRNISAHGVVKHLRLQSLVGHRYALREIAPGYLEIDLRAPAESRVEGSTHV